MLISIALVTSAQVPQKFNYQAVVRDAQHHAIIDQEVGFKLSILAGSTEGPPVYVETHTVSSDANGLVAIEVGGGSVVSGDFS